MGLSHVSQALVTQIIFGACLAGLNLYLKRNKQSLSEGHYYELFAIIMAITVILYLCVSVWNDARTWWFYLTFIPVFATSCFDVFWATDIFMEPNGVFLAEYISVEDPHVHNTYNLLVVLHNASLLHLINLLIIYRSSQGRSVRSLVLFSTLAAGNVYVVYVFCAGSSSRALHPLTQISLYIVPIYWFFPLGPLLQPRNFKFTNNPGILTKIAHVSSVALLLATAAVFLVKLLVLHGHTSVLGFTSFLSVVKKYDPIIFLDEVSNSFPYAAAGIWRNIIVGLPLAFICVFYHFKSNKKPLFLWEVSVFQAALIIPNQFIFIVGPLFWCTPSDLRLSFSGQAAHLVLNGIPILASFSQILCLLLNRVPEPVVTSFENELLKKEL